MDFFSVHSSLGDKGVSWIASIVQTILKFYSLKLVQWIMNFEF